MGVKLQTGSSSSQRRRLHDTAHTPIFGSTRTPNGTHRLGRDQEELRGDGQGQHEASKGVGMVVRGGVVMRGL